MPTNLKAERSRRSYQLNSLYSLLGPEVTFASIAVKWLQTKGSMSSRHNFINSMLAETWDMEKAVNDQAIFREDYGIEIMPQERTPIMVVDVQHNHLWVLIRTYAPPTPEKRSGESWMLFAERVDGGEEEIKHLQEQYSVESKHVVLDIAHFTNMVCQWIVRNNWRGMWGSEKTGFVHTLEDGNRVIRDWSVVNYRDPHLGTKFAGESGPVAQFVYWSRDKVLDLVSIQRYSDPPIFHVHANAAKEYQRHMNSHIKTLKRVGGRGRMNYVWKGLHRDDHLLDCELMGAVRATQLGLIPSPDEIPAAQQRTLDLG